jgi:hypothetical protein
MKRIMILAAAGALVAAPALGTWAASAADGAPAPAVHVRHVERDDARSGGPEPGDDHGRHHRHHRHHRHDGRDDAVRHVEAGAARGGRGEREPGDDHGGRHDGGRR